MGLQEAAQSIKLFPKLSTAPMAGDTTRRKAQQTPSASKMREDTSYEKTFASKEDKVMICERCEDWYCNKCIKMKPGVYEVLSTAESTHWFCDDCQKRAKTAVVTNKNIEETVKKYMAGMTVRMEAVENKLYTKANIVVFDLDERDAVTAEERKDQDVQALQEVLETIAENNEQSEFTGKSRTAVKKGTYQEGHDTERTTGVQKASGRERQQEERSNRERRGRHSVVNLVKESGEAQASTSKGRLTPNKKSTKK